jgi:hypothetical protein
VSGLASGQRRRRIIAPAFAGRLSAGVRPAPGSVELHCGQKPKNRSASLIKNITKYIKKNIKKHRSASSEDGPDLKIWNAEEA